MHITTAEQMLASSLWKRLSKVNYQTGMVMKMRFAKGALSLGVAEFTSFRNHQRYFQCRLSSGVLEFNTFLPVVHNHQKVFSMLSLFGGI
mmetsp:Transcript_12830/g.23122  ORF Transcript_12830/g.23122 Transcript_12830/m.23122 type:complete len:90 (+) Transcript_12830:1447-1716(+)